MITESSLFLFEAVDLINSTTIIGVLYGIIFTLYCLCTSSLYLQLQNPDKRRRARFSLGFISLSFICSTCLLALNARMIHMAYINHADFPGGPIGYETSFNSITSSYDTIVGSLQFVIEVLTMAIQLRRLQIIWSGTQYGVAVTILPLLLLFSYMALDIPTDIVPVPDDQLGISSKTSLVMGTAAYAALSGFTILVTGLIAVRLLLIRRQHMKIMGMSDTASPYLGIIAILTESYVLDSAWSLGTAISFTSNGPSFFIFLGNDSTIKIIAYFLVVYRVANGQGWTKETEEKLTSLQWNHGSQVSTGEEASGIRSQAPATTTIGVIDSPLIPHSDSAA